MPSDGNNRRSGDTAREDSFLARWSRRKHEAEHGGRVEETEAATASVDTDTDAPATDDSVEATPSTPAPDAEPSDTAAAPDLPHPDTLEPNSDFSAYLTKRVSSAFRRAAMRRLFSSPAFNVRDGLDDYDEDYTQFQSLGNTVTAHMRHHTERLRQRAQDNTEQAEQDVEAEREHSGEQGEPEHTASHDTDATAGRDAQQADTLDEPTPADDAPEPTGTTRTATNRDTDDTT